MSFAIRVVSELAKAAIYVALAVVILAVVAMFIYFVVFPIIRSFLNQLGDLFGGRR